MTEREIAELRPDPAPRDPSRALAHAQASFIAMGLAEPSQQMGQRWPIGCVALEITQRCNLDCTLCYLSESAEAVKDLPLEEVMRRIEMIAAYYGANTDVQVTGGEPTLRKHDELIAIVGKIRSLGLRPTLMTNGIRATRSVLRQLANAGLCDVVFHVDTTQERKGYANEEALNAVRLAYIERTQGLPLSVMFNTTVHDGNFDDIPAVAAFFRTQAGRVRTASFQLQADIGRGVQGMRQAQITPNNVARQIEAGAGTSIHFAASLIGHFSCNRYGMCFEAGDRLYDAFDDPLFIARMQAATASLVFDRAHAGTTARMLLIWLLRHPAHWAASLRWLARKAWQMKAGLVQGRGRVCKISFVIHNFMDGKKLEADRIAACVFKIMTADGPLSMCLHNAKRDSFVLKPIRIHRANRATFWNPLSGQESRADIQERMPDFTGRRERLRKGRAKPKATTETTAPIT